MVEKAQRSGGDATSRSAHGRRFEVFVREERADPVRHVGTVAAPTPDAAHEEASRLFAWYARDVWVCPSEETYRYSTDSLAEGSADDAGKANGDAPDANPGEPRVYDETEGTPAIAYGGVDGDGKPKEDEDEEEGAEDAP